MTTTWSGWNEADPPKSFETRRVRVEIAGQNGQPGHEILATQTMHGACLRNQPRCVIKLPAELQQYADQVPKVTGGSVQIMLGSDRKDLHPEYVASWKEGNQHVNILRSKLTGNLLVSGRAPEFLHFPDNGCKLHIATASSITPEMVALQEKLADQVARNEYLEGEVQRLEKAASAQATTVPDDLEPVEDDNTPLFVQRFASYKRKSDKALFLTRVNGVQYIYRPKCVEVPTKVKTFLKSKGIEADGRDLVWYNELPNCKPTCNHEQGCAVSLMKTYGAVALLGSHSQNKEK